MCLRLLTIFSYSFLATSLCSGITFLLLNLVIFIFISSLFTFSKGLNINHSCLNQILNRIRKYNYTFVALNYSAFIGFHYFAKKNDSIILTFGNYKMSHTFFFHLRLVTMHFSKEPWIL